MTKRLSCYLLLSVALHLLLLWLPGVAPSKSIAPRPGAEGGRVELRLRILGASSPMAVEPVSEPAAIADDAPRQTAHSDVAEPVTERSPDESPSPSPLPILPPTLPRGFDRGAYLSGEELDVRPAPEQPIIIGLDDPKGMSRDKGQVVLLVYVSVEGTVDNVDIDSADVPAEIADSLAAIFRSARMRPGIKDALPVKSRMKILVEFEVRSRAEH